MTELSILLTSFNDSAYLGSRIQSILLQLRNNDELIIIDDASSDTSIEIIRLYSSKDKRISVHFNNENTGPATAANIGVQKAKGKYLCWLAADDILLPNFVTETMGALAKYPAAGIACSDYAYFVENQNHITTKQILLSQNSVTYIPPKEITNTFFKTNLWIPGNTSIVKKSLVVEHGLFRKEFGPQCDWFLLHSIALLYGVIVIPHTLAAMRIKQTTYSATVARNHRDSFMYKKNILNHLLCNDQKELKNRFLCSLLIRHLITSHIRIFLCNLRFWPLMLSVFFRCLIKYSMKISEKANQGTLYNAHLKTKSC